LISKNVPSSIVIIRKNRVNSALKALDMGAKIIILDDGFQYRKIFRNIDIVLYSPLPTFQREFFSSISRANIVLINEGFMEEKIIGKIKKLRKDLSIFQFRVKNYGIFDKYGSRLDLKNENVIAFCGIAKPFRFLKSLESLSIKPERVLFFPDHHRFDLKDIKRIEKEAEKSRVEIAITTEKDFIRLSKLPISIKIVYSKIGMEIEENFYNYILEKLKL
jgi:tetraacyldisaccharide 4'-kinase